MVSAPWNTAINWETPAGRLLKRLAAGLPPDQAHRVTVFGSAPIQLMIDESLLSGDVDVFSPNEELEELARAAGLTAGQEEVCIQVSSELNFRTSPRWRDRTQTVTIGNCTFVFPHPIDILLGKLTRLEEKDLEAFRVIRRATGHPTEAELIEELQAAVDLFRPAFDEEKPFDMAANCRRLWREMFVRDLDPRLEIIAPALARRREGYGDPPDYKTKLREMADGQK